ncbi:putative phthalate -dioxygenase oxygenase reductase subunit [Rosellinia necatrix]|uniref:Putative phthalate-dioxygenase oxygenase reductase subunit n=1 Tax=Rosellinia necatrix TaxID=77044 RepID=A0A1S7UUH2_ROSNE|nr:putative phthalate -dioxygenase oxygenase reductase subunit [Rosellinia necatrix]
MDYYSPESDLVPLPPKVAVLSLRTGKVRPLGGVKITSAINKQPRRDRVRLTRLGFAGDERQHPPHQSPDNAIHQYDPTHYERWRTELPDRESKFAVGAFGENISTRHLSESNVCVGDKYRLGDAIVQVTMTRQPCFKLNHRFEHKKMSSLVQATGRTGWLYRVLREGWVEEGADMELIERVNPTWPLSRLQHFLYTDRNNAEALTQLINLPGLSDEFVDLFQKRLEQGAEDMNGRLQGDVTMPWRSYTLIEKTSLTPRIQQLVFGADDENVSPDELHFGPFPHVRVKFGPDAMFTRAYSVVSGDMKRFELGVAKDDNSRGGSVYLHDNFFVGDKLKVAKGHASPNKWEVDHAFHSRKHIFILGGIGITAFLGEIRTLAKQCAHLEIHYAVRSRSDAAYLDQLPEAGTTVYAKTEGQRVCLQDIVPPLGHNVTPGAVIYCCGPASMVKETRDIVNKLGYPRSHVHFEEFGGGAVGTGDPFEVEVEATGKVLPVPREKSLLQVLNDSGFDIDSSCLAGNCGACMVEYCKGEVLHQGVALDDEQKTTSLLSCVSRGKGRIVVKC